MTNYMANSELYLCVSMNILQYKVKELVLSLYVILLRSATSTKSELSDCVALDTDPNRQIPPYLKHVV